MVPTFRLIASLFIHTCYTEGNTASSKSRLMVPGDRRLVTTYNMSLNGLDDEKVQGALEAAVAEPGGWYGMLPSVYILPVIFFHFISNLTSTQLVPT